MKKNFNIFLGKIINKLPYGGLISMILAKDGYLKEKGWLNSNLRSSALDFKGNPIPWLTYSFISFLETRLKLDMDIFEFGSGASTIWFSKRVGNIVSIENDTAWYKKVKPILNSNVELILSDSDGKINYTEFVFAPMGTPSNYANEILQIDIKFDIIIVDGVDRLNCVANSIKKLKNEGVIIIDNLEFEKELKDCIILLNNHGFKRLDFWGLSPAVYHETCTSVFYKEGNCLEI